MTYEVLVGDQPRIFLKKLDSKSKRICRDKLLSLQEDPYPRPGSGEGDTEKITYQGQEVYRIHISRTYTAFYDIIQKDKKVQILEILPIDEAHNKYGTL